MPPHRLLRVCAQGHAVSPRPLCVPHPPMQMHQGCVRACSAKRALRPVHIRNARPSHTQPTQTASQELMASEDEDMLEQLEGAALQAGPGRPSGKRC